MASTAFNRTQIGIQSAFGTAVAPTILAPFVGAYEDRRKRHTARYDAGTLAPRTIVADVAHETAAALVGTAMFETMPVMLNFKQKLLRAQYLCFELLSDQLFDFHESITKEGTSSPL